MMIMIMTILLQPCFETCAFGLFPRLIINSRSFGDTRILRYDVRRSITLRTTYSITTSSVRTFLHQRAGTCHHVAHGVACRSRIDFSRENMMLTQCSVIAVWKGIEPYPPPRWILEEAGEHHVCYRLIRDLVNRIYRSSAWLFFLVH